MLTVGQRLWHGGIVSAEFAATYNAIQEKIAAFQNNGKPVPENILNGSHNLINQYGVKK